MKALSIRQPWAHFIVTGEKDIENRKWNTKFRGTFLVHASQTVDYKALKKYDHLLKGCNELKVGGIVGFATIVDVVTESKSEWFQGPYGFVLENPKPIEFVPYKGKLNFFNVELGRYELK